MKLEIRCCRCKKPHTIDVDEVKYEKWLTGKDNIQDIFPDLSADERELMISQICGECWCSMFGLEV